MASIEHIAIAPNGRIYVAYDNMVAYYKFENQRYVFKQAQLAAGRIKLLAVSNSKVLICTQERIVSLKNADLVSEELLTLEHFEEPLKLHTTHRASLIVSDSSYTTIHYRSPYYCINIKITNDITNIETIFSCTDTRTTVICFHSSCMNTKSINIIDLSKPEIQNSIETPYECSAIAASANGTKVAVSSEDGTKIMVYDILSKNCLHRLKKSRTPSGIYNMTFSGLNDKLVVSSLSKTIHVFNVGDPTHPSTHVSSFATCALDNVMTPSKCHLIVDKNNLLQNVVVVTQKEIYVYKYKIGVRLCRKVSEQKLINPVTKSLKVSKHHESKDKYKISNIPGLTEDSRSEFSVTTSPMQKNL